MRDHNSNNLLTPTGMLPSLVLLSGNGVDSRRTVMVLVGLLSKSRNTVTVENSYCSRVVCLIHLTKTSPTQQHDGGGVTQTQIQTFVAKPQTVGQKGSQYCITEEVQDREQVSPLDVSLAKMITYVLVRTIILFVLYDSCLPFVLDGVSSERRTALAHLAAESNHHISTRWNGNYKHKSKKLCDVPKAKKLQLELKVPNGQSTVVYKKKQETLQHVLTMAMIWALYLEEYPRLEIEQDISDPDYLPDVVSVDSDGVPLFWGESGRMKVHKAVDLLQRYPGTHIVHCRWGMEITDFSEPLEGYLQEQFDLGLLDLRSHRTAKFIFCSLPLDVWRFIDEDTMTIHITKADLKWKELELPSKKTETAQQT